jgi:hypothetical protein
MDMRVATLIAEAAAAKADELDATNGEIFAAAASLVGALVCHDLTVDVEAIITHLGSTVRAVTVAGRRAAMQAQR